ncbi:hypothetical protein FHR75_001585 [Kineococcus radiotolerans]|uniref:O-antigen polymerase n=1 Tax=Kineococcus radiotolerans TaxID=131568 RepID=A0A7W4XWU6_KINRA|nr:hypothetical protein [Kineococcus radiotolerans]MBB2900797.1 hypothetical protein [Kineococcus radiotolerans]
MSEALQRRTGLRPAAPTVRPAGPGVPRPAATGAPRGAAPAGGPGAPDHHEDRAHRRTTSTADARVMVAMTVVIVSLTVVQRLALPLGSPVPVTIPIVAAALGYLAYHGLLREDGASVRTYLLAMGTLSVFALVDIAWRGTGSLTSLLLLVVTWAALCFRVDERRRHLFPRVQQRFETFMLVFAVLGIVQMLAQFSGAWSYTDYIREIVPPDLVFQGYNTSYPIEYGSPVIKANAFVFVEPSVFSQFLALALLSTLSRGRQLWRVAVFGVALVCTVTGTGFMVLGFGLLVLAVRRGGLWAARAAVVLAVGVVAALLSPIGPILLSRTGEAGQSNSSGSLRFVQPYEYLLQRWSDDPWSLLTGLGPGMADRISDAIFARSGLPISFAGGAKMVLEYGLPASVLVGALLYVAVVRRSPAPAVALAAVFLNAVTSSSFLAANIFYVVLPMAVLFAGRTAAVPAPSPADRPGFGTAPSIPWTVVPTSPTGANR